MSPHWSDDFFDGPWVDLHLSFRSALDIEREADATVAFLGLPLGASIVDIPCGPGDHTIELARRGYCTTGIDLSEALLGHAKARALEAGTKASFVRGDMRSVRLDQDFDALVCLWGSFGYFDDAGDRAQLETFRRLLRPGGVMLIDQRTDAVWTFHRDGDRIVRKTSLRLYTVRELIGLLEEAGFENVAVFDPETRDPFALGSVRAWVQARRPCG
jgi:SAM-dependent methyltransferase